MIMKTVEKGANKIEHVEYGDNAIYFYSSKDTMGFTRTEEISRRITGRIMRDFTDEEYNKLLETVIKSARKASGRKSSLHDNSKHSCISCFKKDTCKKAAACHA